MINIYVLFTWITLLVTIIFTPVVILKYLKKRFIYVYYTTVQQVIVITYCNIIIYQTVYRLLKFKGTRMKCIFLSSD